MADSKVAYSHVVRSLISYIGETGVPSLPVPSSKLQRHSKTLKKVADHGCSPKNPRPKKNANAPPERKHIQVLAAAALEVLINVGDSVDIAADRVARHVNHWPGMGAQEVAEAEAAHR